MKKLRVAVLTGGPFMEHESSVLSGGAVEKALARTGHEVVPVLVKRNSEWSMDLPKLKEVIDLVFIAMHGKYGEDGTVQDILGQAGIPYTGTNALASALGINKVLTGQLFRALGFSTPRFVTLERADSGYFDLDFDFPVTVKPVNRGLSLGVSIVRDPKELDDAISQACEFSKSVIAEEYIRGRELSVCAIDNGGGEVIPMVPVHIVHKATGFHDYYTKHTPHAHEAITRATLSQGERDLAQAAALLAHQAIGANGISKTDMILDDSGRLYLLEINTIPSFIETSALAKAASFHGLSLTEVCERIIEAAYDSNRAD